MSLRLVRYLAPVFILFLSVAGHAAAQDYPGFPNTIMAPTHGTVSRHRVETLRRAGNSRHHRHRNIAVARGSSGSVLPTPMRTPLVVPEGGSVPTVRVAPQEQGPTAVPGLSNPIPNLPHGTETFQDRASRCVMQQGLYGVPGGASTAYTGACLQ